MFNASAADWMSRLANEESANDGGNRISEPKLMGSLKWNIPVIDPLKGISELTADRWCLAGVDFHCTNIADELSARCRIPIDELRTLIWVCSSSKTNKIPLPFSRPPPELPSPSDLAQWRKVETAFTDIAMQILHRILGH